MAEGPRVGLVSLGVGLAAAGVGAVVGSAVERVAMGRPLVPGRHRGRVEAQVDEFGIAYGSLRGRVEQVRASDGTLLHVEVDEPAEASPQAPTLVFSHGYALTLDSWHYQRMALRGRYRMVFWDQRGHGRSERGPRASATIDQVGEDLAAVLEAVAPQGPLVLVGHSMGGMTVMSLAAQRPDLVRERVLGAALVSTSAGGLGKADFGLPGLGPLVHRVAPATVSALSLTPGLVQRGRRLGSDLESVLVRRWSYAGPVSPGLLRFTAAMIAATDIRVIGDFLPAFGSHDKRQGLEALSGAELLVLVGDGDLLTPTSHSEEIAALLPGAEHVVVRHAGHLVMLEHPGIVTAHLEDVLRRATSRGRSRAGRAVRARRPVTRTVTAVRRRHRREGVA
ncbi:MAG: alpha/beta hydrolase [Kineosporiaceae bacterium]